MRHTETLHPQCEIKITKDEDVWIKLQRENEWIYGLSKEITLNVICNGNSVPMKLLGTGILRFNTKCQIIQPEMTISSTAQKFSKGDYNFDKDIPKLNLSTMMNEHKKLALNFTIDHTQQLQIIHEQLNRIHEQTYLEKVQHYTHFSLHFILGIVAIGFAVLIWIKRDNLKKLCKLLATYTLTTSGNLIDISWRYWIADRRNGQVNNNRIRSRSLMQSINTRGQDVQVGHFGTI